MLQIACERFAKHGVVTWFTLCYIIKSFSVYTCSCRMARRSRWARTASRSPKCSSSRCAEPKILRLQLSSGTCKAKGLARTRRAPGEDGHYSMHGCFLWQWRHVVRAGVLVMKEGVCWWGCSNCCPPLPGWSLCAATMAGSCSACPVSSSQPALTPLHVCALWHLSSSPKMWSAVRDDPKRQLGSHPASQVEHSPAPISPNREDAETVVLLVLQGWCRRPSTSATWTCGASCTTASSWLVSSDYLNT